MKYLTAILPPATERVCQMSHEFPAEPMGQAAEHELREFIALCLECGAMGFFLETPEFPPVATTMGAPAWA